MERDRGRQLDVNRSTESRDEQFTKYYAWIAFVNGTGPRPNHGRAIHPDESWHCLPRARAVDTDDDEWIRQHPEYGWRFVVKDERWHAQYYPEHDKFKGEPIHGTPATEGENDMALFILERKNAQLAKSVYDPVTGKAGRQIGKDENTAFRKGESIGAVVYVTVSDAEYRSRGGKG